MIIPKFLNLIGSYQHTIFPPIGVHAAKAADNKIRVPCTLLGSLVLLNSYSYYFLANLSSYNFVIVMTIRDVQLCL